MVVGNPSWVACRCVSGHAGRCNVKCAPARSRESAIQHGRSGVVRLPNSDRRTAFMDPANPNGGDQSPVLGTDLWGGTTDRLGLAILTRFYLHGLQLRWQHLARPAPMHAPSFRPGRLGPRAVLARCPGTGRRTPGTDAGGPRAVLLRRDDESEFTDTQAVSLMKTSTTSIIVCKVAETVISATAGYAPLGVRRWPDRPPVRPRSSEGAGW